AEDLLRLDPDWNGRRRAVKDFRRPLQRMKIIDIFVVALGREIVADEALHRLVVGADLKVLVGVRVDAFEHLEPEHVIALVSVTSSRSTAKPISPAIAACSKSIPRETVLVPATAKTWKPPTFADLNRMFDPL